MLLLLGCDSDAEPDPDAAPLPDSAPMIERGDIYVPPPPPPDSGPPESDIQACTAHIVRTLDSTGAELGCADFNDVERTDPASPFNREEVVAACMQLICEGRVLEGHNGIPAVRTCADLEELELVMEQAGRTALDGECTQPSFKVRIIPLDGFIGGEACDQFFCTVGPDGTLISQLE